ncbi:phosphoribosylaminoimidazolesuccinocarboxamide synthase [Thermaerobacter subterraneus]|uniref:Phosphoribosylaminoimidazole-succinocarboxamide synthase n=1 Tax=Thermaerobacter subterraneus DSM 13965 TaxID=867903 RepID=K6Q348_9FIRM|nr:phosphoribosylaminoimidazolesuccinocarboxamide synthase [Thermaerobacter subterraneus]EKP95683.1 phosphoribosylaminoimidazolesuccinocarboxamide (SAICAR) synthase [Thermaerobacter subterraneus DSM 13965]
MAMAEPALPPRGERLYEGKAKVVFATPDPGLVRICFKDDATAFDGRKRGTIGDKGRLNARISAHLLRVVEAAGIPTHLVAEAGERELLCRRVEIIPLEVVVRNVVAGSLARRLGLEPGRVLDEPVTELYYKRDDLGDPLINRAHVRLLGLATAEEVDRIEAMALAVNRVLRSYLLERDLVLVDFKLEFGRAWTPAAPPAAAPAAVPAEGAGAVLPTEPGAGPSGQSTGPAPGQDGGGGSGPGTGSRGTPGPGSTLLLADEISPDTCRLWDRVTGEPLDKDRFRQDLGGVAGAYAEVWRRLEGQR